MERPNELRRCLLSIMSGRAVPYEILVSDDSRDGAATAAVCAEFSLVRYSVGPRRGLCANRNAVVSRARTDYISLLDDDVVVSPDFVARALELLAELPPKTLVTGTMVDEGRPIVPGNPTFLGFFGRAPRGHYKNINLISNIFPRAAFDEARFDELIAYGYEDMDLCSRLLSKGYVIKHVPDLVNTHLPPPRTKEFARERLLMAARARFYTSVKRYLIYERSISRLAAYALLAPTHRIFHALKTRDWPDIPAAISDMGFALRAGLRERARERRAV